MEAALAAAGRQNYIYTGDWQLGSPRRIILPPPSASALVSEELGGNQVAQPRPESQKNRSGGQTWEGGERELHHAPMGLVEYLRSHDRHGIHEARGKPNGSRVRTEMGATLSSFRLLGGFSFFFSHRGGAIVSAMLKSACQGLLRAKEQTGGIRRPVSLRVETQVGRHDDPRLAWVSFLCTHLFHLILGPQWSF